MQERINRIKKEEKLKTRIAENKMAALVAQMNPHFIFNSLQSINSYILKKDRKQASEYLGRFSKLMRLTLENSRRTSLSIEKEIELLKLYLKVESQRFKIPFDYTITVCEGLDTYNTYIPSMMLQPFVENSIWHGLSGKEEGGRILIDIQQHNDLLKCVVEDNGVGRDEAAKIVKRKGKSHKSRALQIITERLSLLFPNQQELCSVRYIDLKGNNNKSTGTRVEIILPFLD